MISIWPFVCQDRSASDQAPPSNTPVHCCCHPPAGSQRPLGNGREPCTCLDSASQPAAAKTCAADLRPCRSAALQAEQERFVVKPFSMRGSIAAEKAAASRANSGPVPPPGHLVAPAVRLPS
jgi:hypothetical protein